MDIRDTLTQELFDSLEIVRGDLNLSYNLTKKIKNQNITPIINECKKLYRKLIDNYLDTNIYEYDSMIYYSPQYKVYQEENTSNILVIVVTSIGKCGLLQITNTIEQNRNKVKNKCLI